MNAPDPLRAALARDRPWRSFAPRAAVTVLALAILLAIASPQALVAAIRNVPLIVWAATAAGLLAGHVVAALKWRHLLRAAGTTCSRWQALRAHGAGLFANLFLPSLVGGDVVRAAALAQHGHGAAVAAGSIADRLIDTAALAALAACGALLVEHPAGGPPVVGLAGLCAALVVGTLAGPALIERVPLGRLPTRFAGPASRLRDAATRLRAQPGAALTALLLSLGIQLAFVWLNARLGSAVGIEIPFGAWLLCWPLAKLLALIPISLGGLGVREAALAALLAGFGVGSALAIGQSLLWQGALMAVGATAGTFALASGDRLQAESTGPLP